ncbi:hypothetical protein UZ36_03595 [Candidatus Nitromaritima sp. SCGC AAA799-C22]|nr:hypothetical protein UZ36_03595 [Candidatus Nitromaritima sp. SCGC AAA799-C22]
MILVKNNPLIRSLDVENLQGMMFSTHAVSWHPLTWLSHAIDFFLFDIVYPQGHHATSVLLHSMNAVWIFFLFRVIALKARPESKDHRTVWLGAMLAALLFGLHPLRVESVAWISERKDVLCAFFFIPALIAYINFGSAKEESKRRLWYWTCFLCHLLALLSKGMAMTLPVVLVLLDIYPLNRVKNWKDLPRLLYEKIPFFLLSVADAVIVLLTAKNHGIILSPDIISWKNKILNSIQSLILYIQKTLIPTGLSPYYPFKVKMLVTDGNFILSFLLLLWTGAFVVLKWISGRRFWMVAFLYFLVTVAPVIGLVQIGSAAAADRYTYLPTLSCIFLLAGGMVAGVDKKNFRTMWIRGMAAIGVLGCFYFLSVNQIKVWSNSISVWKEVISIYPRRTHIAHANLGVGFRVYGDFDRALREYKIADEIAPGRAAILNNIGVLYLRKNNLDQAIEYFKKAITVNPEYTQSLNNLGYAYYRNGWLDKAEKELNRARLSKPHMVEIYINLGLVYMKQGEWNEAERVFKKAIKIQPSFHNAYSYLGKIYQRRGMKEKAESQFKLAYFWGQRHAKARNEERQRMKLTLDES